MSPFEKLMLQAQGRNPDLEEKLRAKKFSNLDRYYHIVFGRGLGPDERRLVESIAAALNTSVDDEYLMQIFMAGRSSLANHKLAEEVSAAKDVIVQANEELKNLYAKQSARDAWLNWACFFLALTSLTTNAWIVRKLMLVSDMINSAGGVIGH